MRSQRRAEQMKYPEGYNELTKEEISELGFNRLRDLQDFKTAGCLEIPVNP